MEPFAILRLAVRLGSALMLALPVTAQDTATVTLLDETVAAVRAAKTIRLEGLKLEGAKNTKIRILYQNPGRARLESDDGVRPFTRVCDGASQWTYYPKLNGYVRVPIPQYGPCATPINAWLALRFGFTGPREVTVSGAPPGVAACRLVIAQGGSACITADRHVVQYSRNGVEYLFTTSIWNTSVPEDAFRFVPPAGAREIGILNWLISPLPPQGDAPAAQSVSNSNAPPELLEVVAPKDPGEGAGSRAVLLYIEITPEGVPSRLQVVGSLGPVADQSALDAVRLWRFAPSRVRLAATVAVNFRIQ